MADGQAVLLLEGTGQQLIALSATLVDQLVVAGALAYVLEGIAGQQLG